MANSTLRFYYSDEGKPDPIVTGPGWGPPVAERCIEEYDTAASPVRLRYYLHGPTYIDEMVHLNNDMGVNTGTFYALQDNLFTVSALINTSGSIVERYKYNVYGGVVFQSASFNDLATQSSVYSNTIVFTGRRLDQFDNLAAAAMEYRARYYDQRTVCFLTRDPLLLDAGLNLYEYVFSSPLRVGDPSGRGVPDICVHTHCGPNGGIILGPPDWPMGGDFDPPVIFHREDAVPCSRSQCYAGCQQTLALAIPGCALSCARSPHPGCVITCAGIAIGQAGLCFICCTGCSED